MSRTKAEWRRHLLAVRRGVDEPTRRAHSAAIAERVLALPAFDAAAVLLTYRPIGAEVDPGAVTHGAATRGLAVYDAATTAGPVRWSHQGAAALDEGALRAAAPAGALLVLVPGVGFDVAGRRLGRGGGYYDRALAALRSGGDVCAVGLAYEAQVVSDLPSEAWDQAMDLVATESRVLRATGRAPA